MSSVIHCIYSSTAARPFGDAELTALLQASRSNNRLLDVSGILLHDERNFFQVIEGPADKVDMLFAKIALDARHVQVTTIIREPIARRAFGDWTMGFSRISRDELAQLTGANDFFQGGNCVANLVAGRAKKLLAAFGNGRWRTSPPLSY